MKTAIISGGTGGIGSEIVRVFADRGYHVVLGYNRSQKQAEALAKETGASVSQLNVCDAESVQAFQKNVGRADVVVHNAGISTQRLFTEITEEEWDEMFAVHVKGAYRLFKAFLPEMIREKQGSLVAISSMWGQVGAACEVHYSAAKAALIGMTKALAKEVGPSGIRVNCVAPGVIDTAMLAEFSEADKKALAEETPLCRLGTPKDVASAVLFAAEHPFFTGQVLSPNGGFVI